MRRIAARVGMALAVLPPMAACAAIGVAAEIDDPGRDAANVAKGSPRSEWQPPEPPPAHRAPQGPLDEFTLRIWGLAANETQADMQARLDWEHRWSEEYIAACMAAEGFIYEPDLTNAPQAVFPAGPLRGTREFAEQFGFGITDFGVGSVTTIQSSSSVRQRALNAMSVSEREAWDFALHGNLFDVGQDDTDMESIPGCSGRAREFLWAVDIDEFSAIQHEVDLFIQSIPDSTPMAELNEDWARCMADAGYPGLSSRVRLIQSLHVEFNHLRESSSSGLHDWDWEHEPAGPPGFHIDANGHWSVPRDIVAEQYFIAEEVALAIADFGCRGRLDYENRALEINWQAQSEFVARHQIELEAWAAFAEARRSIR